MAQLLVGGLRLGELIYAWMVSDPESVTESNDGETGMGVTIGK